MTDVFLTTCATPADPIRWHIFQAVHERWKLEPDIRLHVVSNEIEKCPPRSFDGWRRRVAEEQSQSDIYLCCDDDCMPMGKDFVKRGLEVMQLNPGCPVLGAWLLGSQLFDVPSYKPAGKGSMALVGSTAGGVNFTRKGVLKDILPTEKDAAMFDESSLGNAVRSLGLEVGYMLGPQVNHLGANLSTLWPEPFTAQTQIA